MVARRFRDVAQYAVCHWKAGTAGARTVGGSRCDDGVYRGFTAYTETRYSPLKVRGERSLRAMSEMRREKQAKRTSLSYGTRFIVRVKKRWKWLLGIVLGSETVSEIFRIWLHGRAMDWLLEKFGSLGVWLLTYKFAGLTFSLFLVLLWLGWIALREGFAVRESAILDLNGNPHQVSGVSKSWSFGFVLVVITMLFFVGYGAYDYYRNRLYLNKYPLGYVIFSSDYMTSAVTPLETHRGLETYQFDFRPVRVTKNTDGQIEVRLPDILKDKKLVMTGILTGGTKRLGEFGGGFTGDDKGTVFEWAEILAIKDSEITFLVGFQRAGPMPPPSSKP